MTKLRNINSTSMLSTSWIDRLSYCRDASVYRMIPEAVAKPKNENEIGDLFNYSRNNKIPITFRTAGTSYGMERRLLPERAWLRAER